ncbi:transglutaminase-like cysteine peptidase [Psychromonas sp.]|uniref:transglutaminase-like cysteine peptidase n=1 Tax=Psychromonas sp. TaxID=1884585 RepID=UPI00356B38AC
MLSALRRASSHLCGGLLLLISVGVLCRPFSLLLDEQKIIRALALNYGERAAKRGKAWFNILHSSVRLDEKEKLNEVNKFFNMLYFVDDQRLWGESNYWATPVEFIGVNGGDCEDFAIAKYFTLLALGIDPGKMRITMVKSLKLNQYHMVLSYYETPASVPLVLDNLDAEIKPANLRQDLYPVYSFNGTQLWLNKEKGRGVLVGNSESLQKWTNLNQRLSVSKMKQPKLRME